MREEPRGQKGPSGVTRGCAELVSLGKGRVSRRKTWSPKADERQQRNVTGCPDHRRYSLSNVRSLAGLDFDDRAVRTEWVG